MNKEALAALLNGRKYREEISKQEAQEAKENGLIVIFGASDDLVEFEGAIYDEISAWNGADFFIATPGSDIPLDKNEETFKKAKELTPVQIKPLSPITKNRFKAIWDPEEPDCSWLIKTDLSHATFDIMRDGELYCRGLVVHVSDLS